MTENNTYSTGELAQLCGTTVRTVQYYDGKGLLAPSGYSEGGRRLYSEEDADTLRFILMLKSLGLGLAQIRGVIESPNKEKILLALLEDQRVQLKEELIERIAQLEAIESLRADIELFGRLKTKTESDMAARMRDKKAWRRWVATMIVVGILMDIAWIGTLILGIMTSIWWPFPVALAFVAIAGVCLVRRYDAHVTYLCPECGADFRPKIGAFFIARHTPKTRLLVCPCCHTKDWCVERYHADALDIKPGECLPGTCTPKQACDCEQSPAQGGDA